MGLGPDNFKNEYQAIFSPENVLRGALKSMRNFMPPPDPFPTKKWLPLIKNNVIQEIVKP